MDEACGKYWDRISDSMQDNIWKRSAIVNKLLLNDFVGKKVLEVGTGLGTAAAAINIVLSGHWEYFGTDVSQKNCDTVRKAFGLEVINTDITSLPFDDGYFDIVIALDVLEHISPEDRILGYRQLSRVMRPYAKLILNIPLEESLHDLDYEHGFTNKDLLDCLYACNMDLKFYEIYSVKLPNEYRNYAWAVGVR